jgi:hypothetical protein
MKKLMLVLIASAFCWAFTMNASAQQADQATTDAVIAMTKAQWAVGMKDPTNVAEQSKDMSDDYTEFNGRMPRASMARRRIRGWRSLQEKTLARR